MRIGRQRTFVESSGLFEMPDEIRKDHDLAFAVQLSLYQKYERGIEAIAKDNGVKSAYFLQPAPAGSRTTVSPIRQTLHKSGPFVVELRIEPDNPAPAKVLPLE